MNVNALVGCTKHAVVLLLSKKDVGLEQVLVEGVHPCTQATLLAHPLACLDVHHITLGRRGHMNRQVSDT